MKQVKREIRTQKQLEKTVAKWQKLLRLQDWRIKSSLVRFIDLPNYESYAGIAPNYEHKTATMYVVHPDDALPSDFIGDTEQLVVHELMHIHTRILLELPRSEAMTRGQVNEEEQLNEILSALLVELLYKKKS